MAVGATTYELDQLIKDAAKHGELVVFVGAGASMLCGSPDWREFASKVVGALETGNALGFLEAEQLRGLGDPRRTLSIAMALAKEKGVLIDFDGILHPGKPSANGEELYRLLSELRPVFVTTNYDKWLHDAGPEAPPTEVKEDGENEPAKGPVTRPKYYLREHLSPALLAERGAVIHLHGSYIDPSSMVVSLKDYIEHYADSRVQEFLSAMFKNYTVLFVGYGLAELEVLDHIIRSNESLRTGSAEPRHVLLFASRSTESVQARFIEHFFRDQCGVRVVPYCIDAKGYGELVEVFKCWGPELDVRAPATLDLHAHLDRYVASPTDVNRRAALSLVESRPELASYLLNSLKDPVWFSDIDVARFFDAEHNPKVRPVESANGTSYQADGWPALRYLEQTAAALTDEHAARVVNIIRAISADAEQRGLDNWRTWWSLSTVLSQLPLGVVTDTDIEMTRRWLAGRFDSDMIGQELGEKLLPRLLDSPESRNWHKAMLLVDVLSTVRPSGGGSVSDKAGVLGSSYLGEVLKTSARKLGKRCGAAAVDTLARRLTEYIGSVDDDRRSYIWRSAIEEHAQNSYKESSRDVLVDAVRDAALGATSTDSAAATAVAKSLLESLYPTLTRVGIYVCGEHYGTVGAAFWACAKPKWFVDVQYWHELFGFIDKGFAKFSSAQRATFLEFVERLEGDSSEASRQEELDETQRRDLLYPASGQGDAEVDARYEALVQRWGPVRDHPDFHTYPTSGFVGDRSPITADALMAMSDENLVAYLRGFAPEGPSWDRPTYTGLASTIGAAVRASEDGFASRIMLFVDLARPYQHGLLRGLRERWSDDKRDIDWPTTLRLVQTLVSSPTFRIDLTAESTKGWEPSVHRVVSNIADLVKCASGTERHMPPEHYRLWLQVVREILEVVPADIEQSSDVVSRAINSPRGQTLEALIYLALAMKREEAAVDKAPSETWDAVGPVLEAELAMGERGLNADFSTICGLYCANIYYLNADWTERNFDRLFSLTNEAAWRCAAQGLAYQNRLYGWLYGRLVVGGHLRRMVFSEDLPSHVAEKALQFLGLAYLDGLENLDGDGLLSELVAGLKVKELSTLSSFFWKLRGQPARASRVLAYWMAVADRVRETDTVLPELESALSLLAAFVCELTPATTTILVDAAPYAQVKHHGHVLVENLSRLASQYPKEVAAIFRATMSGFLPDVRREDVVSCINRLAEAGEVEEAEWICNAYAERGSTTLKETYAALRARQRSALRSSDAPVSRAGADGAA